MTSLRCPQTHPAIVVTLGELLDWSINGLDCRPDCLQFLPGKAFFIGVGVVGMAVSVVGPLLLALVR